MLAKRGHLMKAGLSACGFGMKAAFGTPLSRF